MEDKCQKAKGGGKWRGKGVQESRRRRGKVVKDRKRSNKRRARERGAEDGGKGEVRRK